MAAPERLSVLDSLQGVDAPGDPDFDRVTLVAASLLKAPVALVTLLAGGYRRSGFGRRVVVAVGVAVLMQSLSIVTRARVQDDAALWPAMYLPILVGLAYVGALLWRLSRPTGPARLRGAPA